jgi:hypothetical protein
MSERFRPNRFESLEQGSHARAAQIKAARKFSAVEVETPRIRSHEKAGTIAAVTLFMIMLSTACSSGLPKEIHLEAENGDGRGEFRHRGNASYNATVWLHEGEFRTMEFKISKPAVYSIGVRYSNDGNSDNVSVSIDREEVGQLLTMDTREAGMIPGEGWNNFEEGDVAEAINLTSGKHKVEVLAVDTDSYGVEIDEVFLFRVDNEK